MGHRRLGASLIRVYAACAVAVVAAVLVACGGSDSAAANGSPTPVIARSVTATVETDPVPGSGDAADDVAIWVNPGDRGKSVIIGTDKKGGLAVYDLGGREIQYVDDGPMNNVDLRRGFPLGGKKVALVAATHRDDEAIALYTVDPKTGRLSSAGRSVRLTIGAYGLCMYRSPKTGRFFVFVNSEKGEVEQWQLFASTTRAGEVAARRVRRFDAGSQTEGCVADDGLGRLYVGEEKVGIWRYGAEPGAGTSRMKIDRTGGDGHLEADVEGLAIAYGANGLGYLIASSQGDDTFAVYERRGANRYLGSFSITDGAVDAVQGTDGIDVSAAALGSRFPGGLFVAQDGKNDRDENTNFKLVPWNSIVSD